MTHEEASVDVDVKELFGLDIKDLNKYTIAASGTTTAPVYAETKN